MTVDVELPPAPSTALTTHQAAKRLNRSIAWVKLHADELGGVLTRRGYRFPTDITIERVTAANGAIKETLTLTSAHTRARQEDVAVTRRVFALLDQGIPTRLIIQQVDVTPERLRALAQEWIRCGQFDENQLAIVHGQKEAPRPGTVTPPAQVPIDLPKIELPEIPKRDIDEQALTEAARARVRDMMQSVLDPERKE